MLWTLLLVLKHIFIILSATSNLKSMNAFVYKSPIIKQFFRAMCHIKQLNSKRKKIQRKEKFNRWKGFLLTLFLIFKAHECPLTLSVFFKQCLSEDTCLIAWLSYNVILYIVNVLTYILSYFKISFGIQIDRYLSILLIPFREFSVNCSVFMSSFSVWNMIES